MSDDPKLSEDYKTGFKDGDEAAKAKGPHKYASLDWKYTMGYRDGYDTAGSRHESVKKFKGKK